MPRNRRSIWKYGLAAAAMALFLLLVALPIATSILVRQSDSLPPGWSDYLIFAENCLSYGMLVFSAAWIFFLGATFASFLNVVAWRVPQGRSILGSSHCPHCNIRLSFKDNLPIIGWLKNRGRCATCRLPISVRYLYVEIALGLVFLIVVLMELVSGGASLPMRTPDSFTSINRMILEPNLDLVTVVAIHLTLCLVLYTFVLIELDRQPIPISVWLVGLGFGLLIPIIWPTAIVLNWQFPFNQPSLTLTRVQILINFLVGLGSGCMVGIILDRILAKPKETQFNTLMFGMSIVGVFIGWQSTFIVGAIWSFMFSLWRRRKTESPPESMIANLTHSPHAWLFAATIIHLATWRWLNWLP